ncbi:MAG TPA: tRNA 2-thiouridine(34) synthase MnmA [Solirubrobacteraceae bacterium]|nr:tRNA 2-thiouridine(34) synthase MnmA [Solirubrobacteraceae bacterium]
MSAPAASVDDADAPPRGEHLISHLERPLGRGHLPPGAFTGAAGGAACGDLIRVSVALEHASPEGRIADAGFDASGCGASIAAGSAVVGLVRGTPLLAAARIGAREIAAELGGLSQAKRHAAELAADALHRALGGAARHGVALAPCARRTLVAMSGGVDSAVAALLLAGEQREAVGVTLELWSDPENDGELSCCSARAVRGARELAHELGMAHLSIDLRAEFRAGVVEPWLAGHAAGLTPNPCVRCNGSVRLDAMLELATRLGSQTLATGHYARLAAGPPRAPLLRVAADERKDQSYVLATLAPSSLARLRFPLGELRKAQVRELARDAGLAVARKRESQDLCFLAGTRHDRFLERHAGLGGRPGPIIDFYGGGVLGEHPGAHAYTVGQRHGLGLSAREPLYVLATDARANTVTVGPRSALLARALRARAAVLHRDARWVDGLRVRAHGRRLACRLPGGERAGRHPRLAIELERPAERTAPGQLACLYAGDLIVGHAIVAA